MLNANNKLMPTPAADYIAKNKPVGYINVVPIYVVGLNQATRVVKTKYQRAWSRVIKLYDKIVKRRAENATCNRRYTANGIANIREK